MADGSLTPNETLAQKLGVTQAKSFAVPLPAPVAPQAPCLTCAKEPVVTIPKTEPAHPPTSPTTSPQPVPPVLPTPGTKSLEVSSCLGIKGLRRFGESCQGWPKSTQRRSPFQSVELLLNEVPRGQFLLPEGR